MKQAIIVHGTCSREEYYDPRFPSLSNSHWIPWLQKQLLIRDFSVATPEMYHAYMPDYELWSQEFEKYTTPETDILVWHSCGWGFLIRWLSEHPLYHPKSVILVAPWLDPYKTRWEGFFDFSIDKSLSTRCEKLIVFQSSNDAPDIQISIDTISKSISGIRLREFQNYGHFCFSDMGAHEFPELLESVL